ncbi:hypothetical protein QZH41_009407 [Actinostola sp. cb2023]|nr:hypothetical protein QZH41_009407 [Actinostola sp. cb2023]
MSAELKKLDGIRGHRKPINCKEIVESSWHSMDCQGLDKQQVLYLGTLSIEELLIMKEKKWQRSIIAMLITK